MEPNNPKLYFWLSVCIYTKYHSYHYPLLLSTTKKPSSIH